MNKYHQLGRSDIDKLRKLILKRLPKSIFVKKNTWQHFRKLEALKALQRLHINRFPVKEERLLLNQSKEILCVVLEPNNNQWKNEGYCPDGFLGKYIWTFQVLIIQEAIWQREEFLDGFHYEGRKWRDGNPYEDASRSNAWDAGYILQLECSKKKNGVLIFDEWLKFLKAMNNPPPHFPAHQPC